MRRRFLAVLASALAWGATGVAIAQEARLPLRNLQVELRWTEAREQASRTLAGQGGVTVGTAGGVDAGGSVVARSTRRDDDTRAVQRVTVLNGGSAGLQLGEQVPLQWLEVALTPRGPVAVLRQAWVDSGMRFELRPRWPGGAAPVTVQIAQAAGPSGGTAQEAVFTSLQLPLDEWVTVAESGVSQGSHAGGVLSSRDAERQVRRLLQMKVSVP